MTGFKIEREAPDYLKEHGVMKKYYSMRGSGYSVMGSSLPLVERAMDFSVRHWVKSRYATSQKPVRVVDFGCGTGVAITALARKFGKQVDAMGFDRKLYSTWLKNNHVRFVHEEMNSFDRIFKPETVDIVYSYHGLWHPLNENPKKRLLFLGKIVRSIKKGGILVCNFQHTSREMRNEVLDYLVENFPDCLARFRTVYEYGKEDLPVLIVERQPIQNPLPRERQLKLFPPLKQVNIELGKNRSRASIE